MHNSKHSSCKLGLIKLAITVNCFQHQVTVTKRSIRLQMYLRKDLLAYNEVDSVKGGLSLFPIILRTSFPYPPKY